MQDSSIPDRTNFNVCPSPRHTRKPPIGPRRLGASVQRRGDRSLSTHAKFAEGADFEAKLLPWSHGSRRAIMSITLPFRLGATRVKMHPDNTLRTTPTAASR